jgi:hypothetical protein
MEETRSSETKVYNKPTRSHIKEDSILNTWDSSMQENLFLMSFKKKLIMHIVQGGVASVSPSSVFKSTIRRIQIRH